MNRIFSAINQFNCTSNRSSSRRSKSRPYSRADTDPPGLPTIQMPKLETPSQGSNSSQEKITPSAPSPPQTLQRSATINSRLYDDISSVSNFWDINGYKVVLKRCDDGHAAGEKLIAMLEHRAKLEESYAKSLKSWDKKWKKYLKEQSPEYGTTLRNAYDAVLGTGEKTADIHIEFCKKLINLQEEKIKTWYKKEYQKTFRTFRVTSEFKKDFENAQLEWRRAFDLMTAAKMNYHAECKKCDEALEAKKNSEFSSTKNELRKKKIRDDADVAVITRETARDKYLNELNTLDKLKPLYLEKMKKTFESTQKFEGARLKFLSEVFSDFNSFLTEFLNDKRRLLVTSESITAVHSINAQSDMQEFADIKGANMEPQWPKFEEYQV